MDFKDAIYQRHSVRRYLDKPLGASVISALQQEIDVCNEKSGLHIQLVVNEHEAFKGFFAHYGMFSGVTDYIVMAGKDTDDLAEKCGYWGEHLVLYAQYLGLNTCWVGATYKKVPTAYKISEGEKLVIVIALGYGKTQGNKRKSKSMQAVSNVTEQSPDWFKKGVELALLAPTAVNQQKFRLTLNGDTVTAASGKGFYSKVDLGIVKYHFEVGAGKDNFKWA